MAEHGTFTVRDGLESWTVTGVRLAAVSTETPVEPRWIELRLYRATGDGVTIRAGSYILHIIGMSVVYHLHDSDCNTGVPTRVDALPPEAEPCPRCKPLGIADLHGDFVVDLEAERHTMHVCEDVHGVLGKLVQARPQGRLGGKLSAPAQRLLEIAAQADEEVERGVRVTRTL